MLTIFDYWQLEFFTLTNLKFEDVTSFKQEHQVVVRVPINRLLK